ncbi:MAG: hypothetical protein ACOCRO_05035 [Halanaerobiales bacterium]
MKNSLFSLILTLILFVGITGSVLAQEVIMELNLELSEEQETLWLAYGIDLNLIEGVWVWEFNGTLEEAVSFLKQLPGYELDDMYVSENKIGDNLENTIIRFGDELLKH